jgi:hypothetical protein
MACSHIWPSFEKDVLPLLTGLFKPSLADDLFVPLNNRIQCPQSLNNFFVKDRAFLRTSSGDGIDDGMGKPLRFWNMLPKSMIWF